VIRTIERDSCARAWLAACEAIIGTGGEGYNVAIDVADPARHDATDNGAIALVDTFLRRHGQNRIVTVANTIFPQALSEAHPAPALYGVYRRDFDKFSHESKGWGQYFDRMTRHQSAGGEEIYPLQDLIAKLKGNEDRGTRYKAGYELLTYNPSSDRKRLYGGPCLSYLSFKRHPDLGLLLTAVYRNHYYVSRLLGNLIGLGQLQAFVAKEAGDLDVGSLTVISTHAEIDTEGGWGITDARSLVTQAAGLLGG
jgi:hypothetical protein